MDSSSLFVCFDGGLGRNKSPKVYAKNKWDVSQNIEHH